MMVVLYNLQGSSCCVDAGAYRYVGPSVEQACALPARVIPSFSLMVKRPLLLTVSNK